MPVEYELLVAADVTLPRDVVVNVGAALERGAVLLPGAADLAGHITVELVSERRIVELHMTYLGDDSPTDVITFPVAGDELWIEATGDRFDSDHDRAGLAHFGDIAICVAIAADQASEAGHTLARELAFLALHGTLHLLGCNDATEAERCAMLTLQEQIITAVEREQGAL